MLDPPELASNGGRRQPDYTTKAAAPPPKSGGTGIGSDKKQLEGSEMIAAMLV